MNWDEVRSKHNFQIFEENFGGYFHGTPRVDKLQKVRVDKIVRVMIRRCSLLQKKTSSVFELQ